MQRCATLDQALYCRKPLIRFRSALWPLELVDCKNGPRSVSAVCGARPGREWRPRGGRMPEVVMPTANADGSVGGQGSAARKACWLRASPPAKAGLLAGMCRRRCKGATERVEESENTQLILAAGDSPGHWRGASGYEEATDKTAVVATRW